uniref:ribosomal protein S18 n=1 Tax=Prototheca paracutis TaxID=2034905 RepID=UPI0030029D06
MKAMILVKSKRKKKREKIIVTIKSKKTKNFNNEFSSNLINYKNTDLLSKMLDKQGKLLPKRITKITSKQQRCVATALKRARICGFLPFVRYYENKEKTKNFIKIMHAL